MTSFTDRFGGITLYPSDLGYQAYSLTTSTTLTWPELGDTSSNLAANFIRASSTVTGAGFVMPDARDVSVGTARRIKNIGSVTIPVFSTSGSTLASVTAGQDYLLSIIDNSTSGGLWDTTQLGAGTSSADAAFLAGNGLTTSGAKLVANWPVYYTGSDGFILTTTADGVVNTWTGGTGGWTIAFDGGTLRNGWMTAVKNDGSGTLTISGNFVSDIDGGSITLGPNDSGFIVSDGLAQDNFYTIGLTNAQSSQFLDLDVSNKSTVTLTSAQAGNSVIVLTGIPSSSPELTIVFPQSAAEYTIVNSTNNNNTPRAGCGFCTLKTSATGGTTVKLYGNCARKIINDGTNIYFADDESTRREARNYLYYADFSTNPWQRGTSFTCSTNSIYTADRTMLNTSGVWTISRQASTASAARYDMRLQRSSGSSVAYLCFDLDLQESIQLRNKPITFAAEMAFSGTFSIFAVGCYTNTTGNARIADFVAGSTGVNWNFIQSIGSAIITTASPTIYYQFVVNPSLYGSVFTGVPTSANQVSAYIQFSGAGTGANDMVNISRVAIVEGNFDGFDTLPPEETLDRCRRFAWVPTASSAGQSFFAGQAISGTGATVPVAFPTPMRTVPTLTVTAANWQLTTSTGAAATASSMTFTGGTTGGGALSVVTTTSLLTAGNATLMQSVTSIANLLFSSDI